MTSLTSDGGVTKEVLVPGSGNTPAAGEEVEVHYVGTLDSGSVFDSSRARGTPFRFELGRGQVIRGWDLGIATMQIGEKARLLCSPEYAYGILKSSLQIDEPVIGIDLEGTSTPQVKEVYQQMQNAYNMSFTRWAKMAWR